jgi:SAM-dependent methyltransferase
VSEIVRAGYDQMADRYASWRAECEGSPELEWVDVFLQGLPDQPDVLELGCGQAEEPTLRLAARGHLTGVDISAEQLRRARKHCPDATFIQADITELALESASFDGVAALYVFNHVPRADLRPLLRRVALWLRPGGCLLATFGRSGGEGVEDDWLGVPMFFASYTEDENRVLVRNAGFEIERDEVVPLVEPEEGEALFQWILARKPQR